jgi:hypothetical protein
LDYGSDDGLLEWNSEFDVAFAWGPLRWSSHLSADAVYAHRILRVPCWPPAMIAGAWPASSAALWARRRRRARRLVRAGCCGRCGYDLRATPEAGGTLLAVCPECGAAAD